MLKQNRETNQLLGNVQVFGPEATQEEFFEGTMRQPVQDFLEGCNRLVFTYGVTNAGKTYTFQGMSRNVFSLKQFLTVAFTSRRERRYDFLPSDSTGLVRCLLLNISSLEKSSSVTNITKVTTGITTQICIHVQ